MIKNIPEDIELFLTEYGNKLHGYKRIIFNRLKDSIFSKPEGFIIIKGDNSISGLVHVEPQSWDSDHFGLKFAKINLILAKGKPSEKHGIIKILLEKVDELKYEYVILKWDINDSPVIHGLEKAGYDPIVDSVTLLHDLKKIDSPKGMVKVRRFKDEDIPVIADLAKKSFKYDRFHADTKLDAEKCDSLHSEWIKNCCNKKLADEVFVAEVNNRVIGFNACKINRDYKLGSIILTGVSSDYRGMGVGNALVDTVLHFLKDNKAILAEVRTERINTPAINLYQKSGFKISFVEKYYRKFRRY